MILENFIYILYSLYNIFFLSHNYKLMISPLSQRYKSGVKRLFTTYKPTGSVSKPQEKVTEYYISIVP